MDRVHYAGGSILTGTAIAHALLDYAEALAQAGTAGTVVVPAVSEEGSIGEARILVGPSSQLLAVTEECSTPDPVDEEWVQATRDQAGRLRRLGAPAPTAQPEPPGFAEQWIAEL